VTDQRFSSFSIPPCKLLLKSAVAGIKNPRLLSLARVIPVLAEFIKRPQAVKSAQLNYSEKGFLFHPLFVVIRGYL
jgi:hypothetical protein